MEDVGGRTPRGVQSRCEHGKRGTGRVAALAAVGLIAGLLLALAGCGPLGTDPGSGVPVGSAGPEGSGAPRPEEQGQMWEETLVRAFPLDFSRTVGLKSGQLSCTVQGVQVLDNVSGLPRENFETWPTVETVDGEGQREILEIHFQEMGTEMARLTPWQGVIAAVLMPLVTLMALSMLQMALSLLVRPIVSFLVTFAILVLAVYCNLPILPGTGAMFIRSGLLLPGGISPGTGALAAGCVILLSAAAGCLRFKYTDLLGLEE